MTAQTHRSRTISILLSLLRVANALPVPGDGYVVHNVSTDEWTGRVLNIALYKGENTRRPLVSKQCRVGNYVTLTSTNILYFGAMIPSYSMAYHYIKDGNKRISVEPVEFSDHEGLTLIPDAEFTKFTEVDLSKYSEQSDIEVRLNEAPNNGRLTFTAQSISL